MSHRHVSAPSRRRGGRRAARGDSSDTASSGASSTSSSAATPSATAEVLDSRPGDPFDPGGPGGSGGSGDGSDGFDGDAEPKKKKPLLRRLVKWISILVVLMIMAGVGMFFIAYTMIDIPNPNEDFTTETTEVYYSDGKHLLGTFAIQNREEVELTAVPDYVQNAVVSAEDRTFWNNAGIDFKGIIRAAWSNARSESTQGASTITQQYVKVLYLTQERTWTRKLKEAILSLKIQRQRSKQEVLQGYLNTIYFGRGAYGIQAAAEAYFDKDVENLTIRQGAVLASVLNSPSSFDPAAGKAARAALLARYQYVLQGMADMGNLDPAKAEKLGRELPKFPEIKETNTFGGQKGHLMNMVEQELLSTGKFTESDIYGGGLRVITTFDYQDQKAAQKAVKDQKPKGLKQLHASLVSIEPGTGAVRALYAGHNYLSDVKNAQFNWAVHGVQPGSSFKPFALIAALKKDYDLDDTFDGNSPYYIDATGEDVENQGDSGGGSFGEVSLLEATEESINTAFVDLTLEMGEDDNGDDHIARGARKILRAAEASGIPEDIVDKIDPVAVTALGFAPVPTIDMADAYATFAAEGEQADWYTVEEVTSANREPLYKHTVKREKAFSEDVAANLDAALEGVIDEGTGTNAGLECPAAGKTGTATGPHGEISSSWFVGYTPRLATAVTYSRGDGTDDLEGYMPTFYGGDYPAMTWQAYMSDVLEDKECVDFPEPDEPVEEPTETTPTETTPTETEPTETETTPTETTPTETTPTETHPSHPTHPTETTPTTESPSPTEPTCTDLVCDGGGGGGGGGGG
ncbi:MAG TPA: transglycosylase domain-containing protein [Nocardioidaceae bacterium]|nr:transglycosylase domain-containing protein [Nocardioidaceae bacterium]